MPLIGSFFGIPIRMYFFDAQRHHPRHVHVEYQGRRAQLDIESGELPAGVLPLAQTRLAPAWIEIHRDDLRAAWQRAVVGEPPGRIEPLR